MKFFIVFMIGLCAVSAMPTVDEQVALARGLGDIVAGWINQALVPALHGAAQTVAELLAQLTAGVAINGLPGLQQLVGKRNVDISEEQIMMAKGLGDLVAGWINQALVPAVTGAAQTVAELLAQLTAGVAINGLPGLQQLLGKRNVPAIDRGLLDSLTSSLSQILIGPVTQALQTTAELAAQLTAAIAIGGIPALQALIQG